MRCRGARLRLTMLAELTVERDRDRRSGRDQREHRRLAPRRRCSKNGIGGIRGDSVIHLEADEASATENPMPRAVVVGHNAGSERYEADDAALMVARYMRDARSTGNPRARGLRDPLVAARRRQVDRDCQHVVARLEPDRTARCPARTGTADTRECWSTVATTLSGCCFRSRPGLRGATPLPVTLCLGLRICPHRP